MQFLVTEAVGFIECHVARPPLARGKILMRIDSLDEPLDVSLENACTARFMSRCDISMSPPNWLDMDSTSNLSIKRDAECHATGSREISEDERSDDRRD